MTTPKTPEEWARELECEHEDEMGKCFRAADMLWSPHGKPDATLRLCGGCYVESAKGSYVYIRKHEARRRVISAAMAQARRDGIREGLEMAARECEAAERKVASRKLASPVPSGWDSPEAERLAMATCARRIRALAPKEDGDG